MRNSRNARKILLGAVVVAGVAAAAILAGALTSTRSNVIKLRVVHLHGFAVPVPGDWVVSRATKPPAVLFAHPRRGVGQESLRDAEIAGPLHNLVLGFIETARLETPGIRMTSEPLAGGSGTRICWQVLSTYQLPGTTSMGPLNSLDVFCVLRNEASVHVNLVVPRSETSGSLIRRFKSALDQEL